MSYGYDEQGYRSAEPHQGISLRVLAGLVMAVISLIIYMTHTEVNPVTGRKQHIAMTVDQEKAMGLEAAPEMASKMGGAVDPSADPRAREVALIGRQIIERSDAGRSPYVGNYHFFLLNDTETVNAFALPGGQVFITRALYDKLADEAELAGVLGHEVGHVVNRHSAEHMAQSQLGQRLTTALGVGASGNDNGQRAYMIAAMVNQLTQLKFSRGDESEADTFGLKYMAQAGFDPSAMLDVMTILKNVSKGGGRQPEFLATHPLPETRLDEIRAALKQEYPDGIPPSLTRGRPLNGGTGGGPGEGRYAP
ncbi:MAG: M48 family metalloprotease [Planctomycetia bacterium]|nr:M48 family metalloprotease [Planctomycetia bacterium]